MKGLMNLLAMVFGLALMVIAKKDGDCEVCISVMDKFRQVVPVGTNEKKAVATIETTCRELSKNDNKEKQLCYFIGASESSASTMLKEVARPLIIG